MTSCGQRSVRGAAWVPSLSEGPVQGTPEDARSLSVLLYCCPFLTRHTAHVAGGRHHMRQHANPGSSRGCRWSPQHSGTCGAWRPCRNAGVQRTTTKGNTWYTATQLPPEKWQAPAEGPPSDHGLGLRRVVAKRHGGMARMADICHAPPPPANS